MKVPTKSYEDIFQNYANALQWMEDIGVKLGSGRTRHYKKTVEYWKDAYKTATDKEGQNIFPDFVNSIFEIYDFIEIYKAFSDIPKVHLSHISTKLQKAVNGPIGAADETPKSTTARNFLFEATLAAKAYRPDSGVETILDAKSDTGIRIGKKKLWVECKRITNTKKIEANVKKASKQIESVLKKQNGSGHRGIVALEVTKILNVDDKIYVSNNDLELVTVVKQIMDTFIKEYSSIWQNLYLRRNKKIVATVVRFAFMSTIEDRKLLVHASQWGMNPRLGISLEEEKNAENFGFKNWMIKMAELESLIKYENCTGTQSIDKYEIVLSFHVILLKTGKLKIDFKDLPFNDDTSWIYFASHQKADATGIFSIEGETEDHFSVKSNSVWLTHANIHGRPQDSKLEIKGTAAEIDIQNQDNKGITGDIEAQFWIAGLRCFSPLRLDHRLGTISVHGYHKIIDYSKICGVVAIRQHITNPNFYTEWLESTKGLSRRLQDLLSFATGRYLKTGFLRIIKDEQLQGVKLYNRHLNAHPYKPPFSSLNLKPLLQVGLNRYSQNLIDKTGIDIALEWHLMPHSYDESRYLAQMTALEHLVHIYVKQIPSNRMFGKAEFKKRIRPNIEDAIENSITKLDGYPDNEEHYITLIEELKKKVGDFNRRSLRLNLVAMLSEYRVPLDGLTDILPDLIETRNQIVHRGVHDRMPEKLSLRKYLSALEELIKRIFLSLIDFKEDYRTFFNKIEFKQFERLPLVL